MKDFSKEGMTMVVVTHKVVFMDNGLIVEVDTPQQVFENTRNERLKQFLSMIDE